MKGVLRTRGSTRCLETPRARSSSLRAHRRVRRKFVTIGNRLPSRAHISSRENTQSPGGRPCFSTWAALASTIRLETSTPDGHSGRQSLQWMQRSACAFSSSPPHSRGSTAPVATWRIRLAWARGEAASIRDARKLGHIRSAGSMRPATPAAMASRRHLEHLQLGPDQSRLEDRTAGHADALPGCRRRPARSAVDFVGSGVIAGSFSSVGNRPSPGVETGRESEPIDSSRRGDRAEVAGHQVRIVADDLAGIELPHRVERVLDLAEDLDQLAELAADELGPHQSACLGARDRPAFRQDDVVDACRQRLEGLAVLRARQVEEGPRVAAGPRPRRHRASRMTFSSWKSRWRRSSTRESRSGGHGEIVEDGDGPRRARGTASADRSTRSPPAQDAIAFRPLGEGCGRRGQRVPIGRPGRSPSPTRSAAIRGSPASYSSTRTDSADSSVATRKSGSASRASRSERRSSRSHEQGVALDPSSSGHERRGVREPDERQQEHRLCAGKRHRAEHRLGHHGERALRPGDQPAQVDPPLVGGLARARSPHGLAARPSGRDGCGPRPAGTGSGACGRSTP